jgi:glucosylceramidase
MARHSRREFIRTSLASGAAWAVAPVPRAWPVSNASPGSPNIWVTDRLRRHMQVNAPIWRSATQIAPYAIILDPGSTRQDILGFGGALTDSTCYVLSQLPAPDRTAALEELFARDQMALNVCQTCIGASDYARSLYSFDESEEPDTDLQKFSIDHDREYILPILKQARKMNPTLFLFSTPWSPPGWMKSSGSMLGGTIRKRYYDPYARYFLRFLEAYEREGVHIDAVTVQNESDTDQDGGMPACLWGQEYEIQFVKDHLGPVLSQAGKDTKIWVLNHNYNLWGRAIGELSDLAANKYIDGVAWHGYSGEPTAMTIVHDAFPDKSAYWTEGGPDITAPDYLSDWAKWAETFTGILRNWARSITAWNLALDEKGNPKIGPFACGGMVTIYGTTHRVSRSGQFWALAHFSRHVQRGAKVFRTNMIRDNSDFGTSDQLSHVGFHNPDGSFVVVIVNRGLDKRVQLVWGTNCLELESQADSVSTIQWS